MSDRSLGRTLRNLCLALLNATLILAALCLWLGWRLADTVQNISTEVTRTVAAARPIQSDFQGLTKEVSALRTDIASLRNSSGEPSSFELQKYEKRLGEIDARLTSMGQKLETALRDPDALIETAVGAAADELTGFFVDMRSCRPESEGG